MPIIVSNDDGRHLRSLLKPSAAEGLVEQLPDDWKKEKKAVTFFDDVTVYLFDQVSQTSVSLYCREFQEGVKLTVA